MSTLSTGAGETQSNWIDRIKANDEQTLRTFYVGNYPNVEKYIINNSGSEEDARDIYQEAFIATWRNIMLDKVTFVDERSVNGYLFRIAKNKWMDVLRTQKREKTFLFADTDLPDDIPDVLTSEEEDYLEQVKIHFSRLGQPCKELLERFYFRKERLREIANHFSWGEATAKNNKYRCLQKLRAAILNHK